VVWPEPCAEEIPDPELDDPRLPEDPELPDDPELPEYPEPLDPELIDPEPVPDELLEPLPAEDEAPVPVPPAVWCTEPGRAKATTPAPTRPAAPTVLVTARSRAWPRRLAAAPAAVARAFGSAEFIGFPPWFFATVWVPGVEASCGSAQTIL
jgi:hypothetical protein